MLLMWFSHFKQLMKQQHFYINIALLGRISDTGIPRTIARSFG